MKDKQHGSSSSSYNIIKGIYENSAMPVIIIDKNMKIIWSNKSSLSQFPQFFLVVRSAALLCPPILRTEITELQFHPILLPFQKGNHCL